MAKKNMNELSNEELAKTLLELRKEQFNLRMQQGSGQLSQPHQLRRVRRDIARVKQALSAKN